MPRRDVWSLLGNMSNSKASISAESQNEVSVFFRNQNIVLLVVVEIYAVMT